MLTDNNKDTTETTKIDKPIKNQWLMFARSITKGLTPLEATKEAKYKGKTDNALMVTASRLLRNVKVVAEIERLQAKTEEKLLVTVEGIIKELDDTILAAKEKGDFSTVARCIELKGKTIGAFVDTVNTNDIAKQAEIQSLTDQERIELRRIANVRLMEMNRPDTDTGQPGSSQAS